jgi:hypothetical protein
VFWNCYLLERATHGKKESSNGARVTQIISSKEISGDAERQKQTHGGLHNYKETADDTHEQVEE